MLTRLLLSMAAVVSSAADECSAPAGQLAGRLVVVTGASRGVGAELARTFASEGALVVVNYYKSKEKAEAVAADIGKQALAVYGDVRVKADMEALVAKAEAHFAPAKVSVLVNNALQSYRFDPTSASASLKTVSWESIDAQMRGTVQGAVNAAQACLPSFEAQRYGKVINVGTNLVYNPVVTYYDYSAAKAALVSFCAETKFTGAFVMNSRVDLHAIDATPARWRGGVGSSPLDGTSAAMRSPRNDLAPDTLVDFHTGRTTCGGRRRASRVARWS